MFEDRSFRSTNYLKIDGLRDARAGCWANLAAFAAGEQGKYYEMANALLENGKSLNEDKFKELKAEGKFEEAFNPFT